MSTDDLLTAAALGEHDEVRRLLDAGTPPDRPGADGDTALYRAAVQGHAAVVRTLLAAGADPDRVSEGDGEGRPLCAAACWGHLDVVTALLDAGAGPGLPEQPGGMTALHWAAANERLAVVRALLGHGADPDARDSAGRTALSHAAERGAASVVRALLDGGARPAAADARGLRPVDLARRHAGQDIEAELRARAGEHAPPGTRIGVRREKTEGGDVRVVAEVREATGELRAEYFLSTGHAEIVRLLEPAPGTP
ncbi:ankyrin repeat domain-containing protein [Nonomuraea candida]|uniref:ankyrin repeat domain-containing protein n=1 Tax=Nonomuraea candida TaxID=359159 RepID=UPI0005BD34E6|nr:ankyrin repeat domain-containing protein [Nonomuraea candida]